VAGSYKHGNNLSEIIGSRKGLRCRELVIPVRKISKIAQKAFVFI
jgi:hypothetical protein